MVLGFLSLVPLVALGALVGVAEANLTVSPVQVVADDIMGFDEPAVANDIAIAEISGRIYAVVVSPDDGVQIIDISDSDTPVLVAAITDGADGFTGLGGASGIEIAEISGRTYAVVAAIQAGVQVIDISCPTVPVPAMASGAGAFTEFGGASEIEIVEISGRTYALVTTVEDGVRILQLGGSVDSIPASPCPAYNEPTLDAMPPEEYRDVDVLVYGYDDGARPITAGHIELLESRGYTVDVSDGPVTAEQVERASVVVGWGLNVQDADARETLAEYVHGGGRLLLLIDTEYATCGSTESPCWFDFTGDAFGFRFDGDIQSGTLIPAGGSGQHPIWNEPNTLREFSDWCCDGYVGEITDPQNVKVIATASGQSYKHGAHTPVSGVPAIVVNDNPAWGGGMVVGTGIDMVAGWHGPDMRMFDNIIGFMLSRVDVDMQPEEQEYGETGETAFAVLTVKPGQSTTLQDVNNLEFSCSGATAVRSVTFEGLASGFGSFITLKIGVGSDTTDHQDLVLTDDGRDIYTATLDDPLEFGGGIFTLSGTIVGEDSVLTTVTYDTVRDEACEVVLDAAGSR